MKKIKIHLVEVEKEKKEKIMITDVTQNMQNLTASPPEEAVAKKENDGVTALDIHKADFYGVWEGFVRHEHKPPQERADAALEIMEAIYARGTCEKVWLFVRGMGWNLYHALENSSKKAEFAVRIAKMLRSDERAPWCRAAVELLSDSKVRENCSESSIETLGIIFSEENNFEEAKRWLAAADAERGKYREAARNFFFRGDSKTGLALMKCAPGKITEEIDDFIELLCYGLDNPEKIEEPSYQKKMLSFLNDRSNPTILLKALCSAGYKKEALDIAEQLSLHKDSYSAYPLLILSEYINEPREREDFLARLFAAGLDLNARELKITGNGPLHEIAISTLLSIEECMKICDLIPDSYTRATALVERIAGIGHKWRWSIPRDSDINEPFQNDLSHIRTLLREMSIHLLQSPFSDFQGHPPFWVQIFKDQLNYDLWDDLENTGNMWEEWRKNRGPGYEGRLRTTNDIWFLSYWGLYQIAKGNEEKALECFSEAWEIQNECWEISKNYANNFFHMINHAALNFLSDSRVRFQPEQQIFIQRLSGSSQFRNLDDLKSYLTKSKEYLKA